MPPDSGAPHDHREVARLAKITVLSITCVALGFAIFNSTTLVGLLLMGYAVVAQLFPGVILGLYSQRATMPGVFAGMVTGVFIAVGLVLTDHDPLMGLNAGFIGLCFNCAVTALVSLLTSAGKSRSAPDFTSALQPQDNREPT